MQSRLSKRLIEGVIVSWLKVKERFLSKQLIDHVISTYVAGVFKHPFGLCDDLINLTRNYW
jgi:hypothetical protein